MPPQWGEQSSVMKVQVAKGWSFRVAVLSRVKADGDVAQSLPMANRQSHSYVFAKCSKCEKTILVEDVTFPDLNEFLLP